MSTMNEQALTHPPTGAEETLWGLGVFVTLKSDGERDKVSFFEVSYPPGAGPPPNVHYQQEEAFYVLNGTFTLFKGEETITGGPGTFGVVPRGTVHTFKNTGNETGTILLMNNLPGAHERFFRAIGVPVADMASFTPPPEPPDMQQVLSHAEQNDIRFVLPAPAGS